MRTMRRKTLTVGFGGTGCIILYWYLNVYLNDLPQTQKTRLTPHLHHREEDLSPSSLENDFIKKVPQRLPGSRGRGTWPVVTYTDRTVQLSLISRNEHVALDGRLKEYCNPPSVDMKGNEEGNVGEEFQLRSVHVIIRHGDRSPIHSIINHPNTKLKCKFDSGFLMKDEILSSYLYKLQKTETNFHPKSDFRNWELYPNKEFCDGAQLTPLGALQHLKIGQFLQEKYFSKVFKGNFSYTDIHIKSTEYSRTFQSAVALLYGFLPDFDLQKIQMHLSPDLLFCSSDITGLTCRCPLAQIFKVQANVIAGSHNRNDSEHKLLVKQIATVYDIKPHQVPWLAAVMDILMTQVCHHVSLHCNKRKECIDKKLLNRMWKTVDSDGVKFKSQNEQYLKFAHLALHPLLSEILIRMKDTILLKNSHKFILYSGHDISLTPLLAMLGLHLNGKWPPYASRVVFELYTKSAHRNPNQGFIRVLYNGKDRTEDLPFCRKLHHGLCRLYHFKDFLDNHLKIFNITDFNTQCANTKK
ncbi:2-phosphoxylose phosphatase 1-like isoform X2 [Ylistrum balloti]|uniref:2-phosphoxylose phosphatase 1-like isoform X2 n=1 Tax=Ylistrum balloti TaxID=509963 RepID=UPI002905D83C|nr:2-phosphoxylose phosphatase 1-like isoform X2 [Ylistrum balloti]